MSHGPAIATPTPLRSGRKASANRVQYASTAKNPSKASAPVAPEKSAAARGQFVGMALNMMWQLAVAVLVPVIAGVQIGKAAGSELAGTFVGLGVALAASVWVLWRTMQTANRLPVPKLTVDQKRAIRKQYEEEDNDD